MSKDGIGALERGHRRTPQRETLALLAEALRLTGDSLTEFKASAVPKSAPRDRGTLQPPDQDAPSLLPLSLSTFVGRQAEIDEIASLMERHRLVTLVGSGGIGKTQTALRIGCSQPSASEGSVCFVSLATAIDDSVVDALGAAAGARGGAKKSSTDGLIAFLRNKPLLLIIDNCEHVISEAARVVGELLTQCSHLRILATSREPLKVAGEHTYRLPSLSTPPDNLNSRTASSNPEAYEAVQLFVDRAAAADHRFTLTDENAHAVADICRRLDGIPLAIELAAARVNTLSVKTISERLHEQFHILSGGERFALPRQQTLHATIDWSYGLLSPKEQRLLERLSVFAGGCAIEDAEAVASDEGLPTSIVLDLVCSLAEKSLIVADDNDNGRYRLLESTRAFALEKLLDHGELSIIADRHAARMANVADEAAAAGFALPVETWVRRFEPHLENARAAIEWTLRRRSVTTASRIVCGFTGVWRMNHGHEQPRRWLETLVSCIDDNEDPGTAARVWHTLSTVTFGTRSIEAAERAMELGRDDDPDRRTVVLHQMAAALLQAGKVADAEVANNAALDLCKKAGLARSRRYAAALSFRGQLFAVRDCFEEARLLYTEALSLMTALGEEHEANIIRINIGEMEYRAERFDRALDFAVEALSAAQRVGSRHREATALVNLAAYQLTLGDIDEARRNARGVLAISLWASPIEVAAAIQHLATVMALEGAHSRAARLRGYVDAWYRSEGLERDMTELRTYHILSNAIDKHLSEHEGAILAERGAALTEPEAIGEALQE